MANPDILIIEDDPGTCESIRFLLSQYGFEAHVGPNLFDAIGLLRNNRYSLVILDLVLGGHSGFNVMDYLTEENRDTQVIIITGQRSEQKAIKALKKGATDYFKKPFDPDAFIDAVQHALSTRRKRLNRNRLNDVISSSRERYRTVIDSQSDYVCRLNADLVITFVNKAFANHWRLSPDKMIGRPFKDHIHTSVHHYLRDRPKAIQTGLKLITIEYEAADKHHGKRWLQWHLHGILDDDGILSEIQCVGRDVTRSKAYTREAEAAKERYLQLAEMTSDWLWEVDRHGVYTYASPVVHDLLGYRPEEVIGRTPFDLMPSDEADRLRLVFQQAIESGASLKAVENVNHHKNGQLVTLETSGVPIFDSSGVIVGYRGVDRDISARKKAERRLNEEMVKLKAALKEVRRLSGMLPICSACKKVRDDKGYWQQIEAYISDHSEAEFSHGLCPSCMQKLYPDIEMDEV